MIERDAQKVEIIALKSQVEMLKARSLPRGNEVKTESDIVSIVAQVSVVESHRFQSPFMAIARNGNQ